MSAENQHQGSLCEGPLEADSAASVKRFFLGFFGFVL